MYDRDSNTDVQVRWVSPPISSPSLCTCIPTRLGLFSLNLCHYTRLTCTLLPPNRKWRVGLGGGRTKGGNYCESEPGASVRRRRPCSSSASLKSGLKSEAQPEHDLHHGRRQVSQASFHSRTDPLTFYQVQSTTSCSICAVPTPGRQTEPSVQADRPSDVSPRSPKPSRSSIKAYRPRLIASADDRHAVISIRRPCTRTEAERLRRGTQSMKNTRKYSVLDWIWRRLVADHMSPALLPRS